MEFNSLPTLPFKDREPFLFLKRGHVHVNDMGITCTQGDRVHQIPAGSLASILLEPGVTITHEAVKICGKANTQLFWIGEQGVKLYSAGSPPTTKSPYGEAQAKAYFDEAEREAVARRMFKLRFNEDKIDASIEQLRGYEGIKVRAFYKSYAQQFGVNWYGRKYVPGKYEQGDAVNQALTSANACLYAVTETALRVAGYYPAFGFIHHGKPDSFVHDVADFYKPEITMPIAFRVASKGGDVTNDVRRDCRDAFKRTKIMDRIIKDAHSLFEVPT
jgi:CRISPR-associated protein Cas1